MKSMKIVRLLALAWAVTFASSSLNAATIDFQVVSAAGNVFYDGIFFPRIIDSNADSVSTLGGPTSASRTTTVALPPNSILPNGESNTSTASADAATGELKTSTVSPDSRTADGFAGVDLILSASVDVIGGSGFVTVLMDYDGSWNLPTGAPGWQAQGGLLVSGPLSTQSDRFGFGQGDSPRVGSGSGTVSVTSLFSEGLDQSLTIVADLISSINGGTSGFVDFSQTALLSVITSEGTTVTFEDPRTLSIDPAAVPLPAALPLLVGGLGLLGLQGWRRKRKTASA